MISGTVNGIDDLSGYTCHFVAKKKLSSTEKAINASSTSRDVNVYSFPLLPTETDISTGNYVFETSISSGETERYIVEQGYMRVKEVLKW